jgi:hypothetical protein
MYKNKMNIEGVQRGKIINLFNYDAGKGIPKTKPLTKADLQNRANNQFLNNQFNFNRFLDQKDGGSGIDKALAKKHKGMATKTSKKAEKANRLQQFL